MEIIRQKYNEQVRLVAELKAKLDTLRKLVNHMEADSKAIARIRDEKATTARRRIEELTLEKAKLDCDNEFRRERIEEIKKLRPPIYHEDILKILGGT